MLIIDLEEKLISDNLSRLITKFWDASFAEKAVSFKLEKLEWISNSEIAFLISWIRTLEVNGVSVSIAFQSAKDVNTNSLTYQKRKYCYERIMVQWRMLSYLSPGTNLIDGGITSNRKYESGVNNFTVLPVISYFPDAFDKDFHHHYQKYLTGYSKSLHEALKKTSITFYDKMFLDYSIVKELFSNTCLHATPLNSQEGYFSIGVIKSFNSSSDFVYESRISELSMLEKSFFLEDGAYRNIDFIEINYHDFGIGIPGSLRKKYTKEKDEDLREFFGERYNSHIAQKEEDSRIIDYAMLLFTSQYEIDRKMEIHDFIPRGLFILRDIVKKYDGYIEVLSDRGGIAISYRDDEEIIMFIQQADPETKTFPGTRIKIILPAQEKPAVKKDSKRATRETNIETNYAYEYLSFLSLLSNIEFDFIADLKDAYDPVVRNKITCSLFTRVLEYFKKTDPNHVVLIDFAGIEPKTADFFNKFIYFVSHFPISSNNKLILYNLTTTGLNSTIIFNDKNTYKSQGFYPYPIPCIQIDLSVEWLGVKKEEHASLFTQLWIGDTRNEDLMVNISNYNNMLIGIRRIGDIYRVKIKLPPFAEILENMGQAITAQIDDELANNGIRFYSLTDSVKDYNRIRYHKEDTCYLTSNGKYLKEYISFNEKLYIFAYRRMIACYFIARLHMQPDDKVKEIKKIGKILSVTLSSQLIGKEVKELLNQLFKKNVELVALSNYYNFQNEEKFNEIKEKNLVLIVNDIISTGTLTQNIIRSIEMNGARPYSCLTITDLRLEPFNYGHVPVISLSHAKLDFYDKPTDKKIEVINPVLNVPTSIPKSRSMENVLLTKEEFFKSIDERYLLVGNMKNNAVYFSYFLQTYEYLKDDAGKGFPFLRSLLGTLKEKKQKANLAELRFLTKGLDMIGKNVSSTQVTKEIEAIKKRLDKLNEQLVPELFDDYRIDVVFYPFLSDISVVESDTSPFLEASLNTQAPLIYPIPRIMTSRGWRFSFPPKFLQLLLKMNKMSVLILDDGSLTGETLMQMLDSVSFLSVKSIDVFSLLGRLEDFQKELFSRIKSIQVKGAVAPVNVFFGVHFNIPIYNSIESPYQTEIREINKMEERLNKHGLSEKFLAFLNKQRKLLQDTRYPSTEQVNEQLFVNISKKEMFIMRDFLGRYDSYRLYADDLPEDYEDQLIGDDRKILTLLTILNMEPQLYQNIRRLFPQERRNHLTRTIQMVFLEDAKLTDQPWKLQFFIKALFYLNPTEFFKIANMTRLTQKLYAKKDMPDNDSFAFLEYYILLIKLKIKNAEDVLSAKNIDNNIDEFLFNLSLYDKEMLKEFRFAYEVSRIVDLSALANFDLLINKYHALHLYYEKASNHETRHDDLLLPNLFKSVKGDISVLRHVINSKIDNEAECNRNLISSLIGLKENFSRHLEFSYIQTIVDDLNMYSDLSLQMNIAAIHLNVHALKAAIENPKVKYDLGSLALLDQLIDQYQSDVLVINSDFVKFIMGSSADIMSEWIACEQKFKQEHPEAVMADTTGCINYNVKVNPYALRQTFDDLMKNKNNFAPHATWRLETKDDEQYQELIIEQNSCYQPDTGDGTGQHTIKAILNNYGAYYKKISDNPYTIQITFKKD